MKQKTKAHPNLDPTLPKRFNLDLSPEAYKDIEDLSRMMGGRSKSEVFRLALSLLKMIYPAILGGDELCLIGTRIEKNAQGQEEKTKVERSILIPK